MTNTIEPPYADKRAIPHYRTCPKHYCRHGHRQNQTTESQHQAHLGAEGTRYRFQCKLAGQDGPCEHVMKPPPQGWFKRPKFVFQLSGWQCGSHDMAVSWQFRSSVQLCPTQKSGTEKQYIIGLNDPNRGFYVRSIGMLGWCFIWCISNC